MVFAAIDVGSNTLRLLLAEVVDGKLKPLRYERVITRLAQGLKDTGRLDETAVQTSVEVLNNFSEIIEKTGVVRKRCVGTSALREAVNSADFIKKANESSGLEIEVVSGLKEAELTAMGVLSSIERPGPFVIVDIGGGSTELICSSVTGEIKHVTVPLGVVKMAEAHSRSDPPSEIDIEAIRFEAAAAAVGLRDEIPEGTGDETLFIGTAGTASTLAAIDLGLVVYEPEKVHGHIIKLTKLREIFDMLKALPIGRRSEVRGLEPQRADLIIPGIILTISLMEIMGFDAILISNTGLLEGIVLDMAGGGRI